MVCWPGAAGSGWTPPASTRPRCGGRQLDHFVQRAIGDPDAQVFVFGERWGPEPGVPDKVFGFRPGNGVHDVHMNQGNSGRFRSDDGVWQDGGLLLHFPGASRW
ncbi:DUF2278 family protein [Nonomuraea jabiensis]|uniref:DUF2278 family protein n=1 Tax=Nonomuraea jabiensis TaxID=882448 RepID=UPI003D729662